MNPKNSSRILDRFAADFIPDDTNLLPQIKARYERTSSLRALRTHPALAVLLALIALMLLGGVAYAIGHSLGYIPGVGVVEQNNGIYILKEPASVKQDGITVMVNRVVSDSTHTYVNYQVDGIPPTTNGSPICIDPPALKLPDGQMLAFTSGGKFAMGSESGSPMRFETSLTFPPLPAQTHKVTFISPCQMPVIELVLAPAPADFATPAAEFAVTYESSGPIFAGTPTPTPSLQADPTKQLPDDSFAPPTPTLVPGGSGLYLDQVVELETSYILVGNFTDAGDMPGRLEVSSNSDYEYRLRAEDGSGKNVQIKLRSDIRPERMWGGVYYWAYEVQKPVTESLTIVLDHVNIQTDETTQFQIDTGPGPKVGQEWPLNISLKLGGYDFIIDSVELLQKGYLLRWHSGVEVPEGVLFTLAISGLQPSTSVGPTGIVQRLNDQVTYSQNFLMDEPVKTGNLTFELTLLQTVPLAGPWTLQWTPPEP